MKTSNLDRLVPEGRVFENVGLSDTEDHVCEVKNSEGTVESSVQLTVELAPTVTKHPVPVFLWEARLAAGSTRKTVMGTVGTTSMNLRG